MNDRMNAPENHTDERCFKNVAEVLGYLVAAGWKTSKSHIYRDWKDKLFLKRDGVFLQKDIDKYAKAHLDRKATGKKDSEDADLLHRKKAILEIENLELEKERRRFAHDRDLGKYVPKEQMEIELAARAGILDAGLKHLIQSRAADWIRTAAGDMKTIGDLINVMTRDLDEHINSYAQARDYEIVIDGEEEKTIEESEC